MRTVTATLVTLAGFLLPFVGVMAVIAVPVILIVVLARRRRGAHREKGKMSGAPHAHAGPHGGSSED